jgi:hypothetical protein
MTDWWSKKLKGEKPSPQLTYPNPAAYSNRPVTTQQSSPQAPVQDVSPNSQINVGTAIRLWKGGEAMKRDGHLVCPSCGSRNVFSRTGKGANSMIHGAAPAPHCFECGWNGMYEQASQVNWVA